MAAAKGNGTGQTPFTTGALSTGEMNDLGRELYQKIRDVDMGGHNIAGVGTISQGAWTTVTSGFSNSWTGTIYYRLDKDGYVSVQLLLNGKSFTSNEAIYALPAPVRGVGDFMCSTSASTFALLYIDATTGVLRIGTPSGSVSWIRGVFRYPTT